MLGLAIDSADRTASAALWRSGDNGLPHAEGERRTGCVIVAEGRLSPEAGKADQLVTVIDRLLAGQGLGYADLDVIAVNRGPGSFTGIRSGVALARGLSLAGGLPVLGITSHEALASTVESDKAGRPLLIALDARRGEVYAAVYSSESERRSDIEARSPASVAADMRDRPWRLAGHGAHLVAAALDGAFEVEMINVRLVDAAAVAHAAVGRLDAGERPGPGFDQRPLYVRAPDAVPPKSLMPKTALSEVPI